MRVSATGWFLFGAVLAALGATASVRAQGQPNANAQPQTFDVTVPYAFTSPDNGQTRCFAGIGCIGVPAGGWAWRTRDIGTFNPSAPRPPFDPNHPQPYWSPEICCTGGSAPLAKWQARFGPRCFVGYGCYGPPPGGWQWTDNDVRSALQPAQSRVKSAAPSGQTSDPSLPVVCGTPSLDGAVKCLEQIANGVVSGSTPGIGVMTRSADMASGAGEAYAEIVQNQVAIERQTGGYFDSWIDYVLDDDRTGLRNGTTSLSQAVNEAVVQIRATTDEPVTAGAVRKRMLERASAQNIQIKNQS